MTDAPVLVFDGVCVLCSRWVHFILRHDRDARIRLAPMQSQAGRALLAEHGTVVAANAAGMFARDPADPELLAELELSFGAEPGALDVGHHILAVLEVT